MCQGTGRYLHEEHQDADRLPHPLRQTQVIAETLHRQLSANLFEIRPAQPYPAGYKEHVANAKYAVQSPAPDTMRIG